MIQYLELDLKTIVERKSGKELLRDTIAAYDLR